MKDQEPVSHLCLVNSMRGWGGAEVWFLDTLEQLHRRGHRVSLICQPHSQLSQRARAQDLPFTEIPIRLDAAPWTLASLYRYFRRTGVTAIIANRTKDLKASAVAGKLARVPTILASRESDFPLKDKGYYRWYFRDLASGVLVASRATRQTIRKSAPWLDPEKVHLIYKGIDTEMFRPPSAPAPRPGPAVGFLGQLIRRKGLPQLLTAWARLEKLDHQPVRSAMLQLAGDGVMRAEVDEWRAGLRHPERVSLAGYVENPEQFLQGLDILVMPSLAEGFGLAAAEAGACGLPVIAGKASSLPEIVLHEETGLLVAPGDVEDLFQGMLTLLDNPDLARKLGAAARSRVCQLFARERTLVQLEKLCGLTPPTGVDTEGIGTREIDSRGID